MLTSEEWTLLKIAQVIFNLFLVVQTQTMAAYIEQLELHGHLIRNSITVYCCNSTHLKFILHDHALFDVLFHLSQYGCHSNICLPRPSGCADQKIFICVICCVKHNRLDTIELLHTFETNLSNLRYQSMCGSSTSFQGFSLLLRKEFLSSTRGKSLGMMLVGCQNKYLIESPYCNITFMG